MSGLVQCLYCLEIFGSVASLAQHKHQRHQHEWLEEEAIEKEEEEVKRINMNSDIKEEKDAPSVINHTELLYDFDDKQMEKEIQTEKVDLKFSIIEGNGSAVAADSSAVTKKEN
ncbi:hypothetical protein CAPTEDRAFT_198887, partial [Capitella teleta]